MKLLEIHLSPVDSRRFQALASQSPAGDGDAESLLPFWHNDRDWRTTLIRFLNISSGFQPAAFPESVEQDWMVQESLLTEDRKSFHPAYLENIGQALYCSLFPDGSSLRSTFESSLRLAEQTGEDLHLRLKFAANSAKRSRLADYPWELLHDGNRFLLHRNVVLSRYIAYEALPPRLAGQERLRVLLVSSPAFDQSQRLPKLSDAEQQAVRQGLVKAEESGAIALDQLSSVTRKGLSVYLTDCAPEQVPQVIHFDGHGLYGKRCINSICRQIHKGIQVERCSCCQQQLPEPEGFLLFEHEQGDPDYVSARELAALLPSGVALVVLSACQSGMAIAGDSLFNGTAQQLIDARIPAVVAMQALVRADAASLFAEQFYRVLGKKQPLVVALREGRKWMMEQVNQWYRPVLYLRWQDNDGGQLFVENSAGGDQAGLSRFQRLEIDRLQTELDDLDQDYESVKAQLRVEQDGPTQNKLQRQIEQIGLDMDQREQRLFRLKRGDD